MTEKEVLEIKIQHLQARKKLITAEIDFKIELLENVLSLQSGFERPGKYELRHQNLRITVKKGRGVYERSK